VEGKKEEDHPRGRLITLQTRLDWTSCLCTKTGARHNINGKELIAGPNGLPITAGRETYTHAERLPPSISAVESLADLGISSRYLTYTSPKFYKGQKVRNLNPKTNRLSINDSPVFPISGAVRSAQPWLRTSGEISALKNAGCVEKVTSMKSKISNTVITAARRKKRLL